MTGRDVKNWANAAGAAERAAADLVARLDRAYHTGEKDQRPRADSPTATTDRSGQDPRTEIPRLLLALLTSHRPVAALESLVETGAMARLLPEVEALRHMPTDQGRHKDVYRHTLTVTSQTPPDPLTRLAALLHDIGKPATKVIEHGDVHFPGHAEVGADMARRRLRALGFDRDTVAAVTLLVALHLRVNSYEDDWTDAAARRLAREAGDQFGRLLDLDRKSVV